ncbi:MAG: GIY-YIG nuclease family protein [Rhodoblastus sp.]
MRGGWVYIMTNHANGVLYVGVTSDLSRRAYEHREGLIKGFTQALRTEVGLSTSNATTTFETRSSAS